MNDDFFNQVSNKRKKIVKNDVSDNTDEQTDRSNKNLIDKENKEQVNGNEKEEENDGKQEINNQNAVSRRHRLKSQELLKNIQNDGPTEVMQEIHNVKDLIAEKLKQNKTDDEEEKNNEGEAGASRRRRRDFKTRLDLGTDSEGIRSARSPDSTMTESTRLRLQKFRNEKDDPELNNLKEKAEDAIREETERSSYRFKGTLRRRDQQTRFDQDDEEDKKSETNDSTDNPQSARNRFKRIGQRVAKEFHMPSKDEQFDFFCKHWEEPVEKDEPKAPKIAVEKKPAVEGKTEEEKEEEVEATDEKTALIQMFTDDDWKNTVYVKATYKPHEEQKTEEKSIYFMPNSTITPLNVKLANDRQNPRYLEKEGFYVGVKPFVPRKNRNLMEDRLVHMPDKMGLKWFGLDGQIISLPDPIKYVATRPSFIVSTDAAIEAKFKNPINFQTDGNRTTSGLGNYRIDIDINKIEFTYHHLFSQEHVLAFKLTAMYQHFKFIEEQNLVKIMTEKLKALKQAEVYLKGEITSGLESSRRAQPTPREITDMKKLMAYKYEIQKTRQERNKDVKIHKQLVEQIIQTWKELKELRLKNQFRNTDVKLVIKKKETNKNAEEQELREEIQDAFQELKSLKLEEYEKALSEYHTKYNKWKFQHNKKKEAQKRQTERESNPEGDKKKKLLNMELEETDRITLQEVELPKPEKPEKFDENLLRQQIEAEYLSTFKQPGHPILSFDLLHESSVTPNDLCSGIEKTRRDILSRTRIYAKLVFNGKSVYKTSKLPLKSDFTVEWGQIFNIYMISWPDSISLQIFETCESTGLKRKSADSFISEVIIPVPEVNCTCNNYDLEKYEFSSPNEYYMNKGNDVTSYYQSGILYAGAGWGVDQDSKPLIPPSIVNNNYLVKSLQNYDAIAALGVSRMQDTQELMKWIFKSNLDPNDPRNADLIELIQAVSSSGSYSALDGFSIPDFFRLDQYMREFNFVTDEESFFNSKRFEIIQLRDREEPEFKNLKMIPPYDRNLQREMMVAYDRRRQGVTKVKEGKEDNEIEALRLKGRLIYQKIRESILKRYRQSQHQKTLADMVVEETVPNLTALGHIFWNLYVEPRRPLYPTRKERKKITGQSVISEEVYILINIASAYDLPIRKDKMMHDPIKMVKDSVTNKTVKVHEKIAGESLITPFVEVSFQKNVFRTATADGPNSHWNQEIRLPFKAPNNVFTPTSLQSCDDVIYFNVYDEIEIDILEDDRDRQNIIHKQIQRNWMGSLEIPFSSLYFNSRIDGTFKLNMPPIMLGYTRDNRLSRLHSNGVIEGTVVNFEQPSSDTSYISLFMTIEPQLSVPEQLIQTFDSIENDKLLQQAVSWTESCLNRFPNREFRATVMDINGKSVFVTRYFRPIKPPEELIENGDASIGTAKNLARFVELIPKLSDTMLFPGICDIWSTCDQFMEVLAGDDEEHSILLTNFFLGLNKKAWLLIGKSAVGGVSTFCLSNESGEYTIWYQGKPYKYNEPHNPILVVSALVNADNIWANIQEFDEPCRINFDTSNTKCWLPFSKVTLANDLRSIQPESLEYTKTDPKYVKDLETRLETRLREKLEEWRPRHITKLNRYGCTALRNLLTRMEKSNEEIINTDPEELVQILNSYRLSGFPINLPYTSMSSIFDAVYATQVHAIPSSDVEFALAVHIHPYPNTVLSVWIYVASLIRKK